jgi:outer membrane protein insertion porin family
MSDTVGHGGRTEARSGFVASLITALLLFGLLGGPLPARAKLVSVTDIPTAIPEDLHYGEILREVRITGNRHTREWVILKAVKSQIGHPYTPENAKLDVLWVLRIGAFTAVTLDTEPVPDGIALTVTVTETTPWIPSLSIRLTQENGIEIGPAVSSSNVLGTAARLSAYARWGGATNYGLRYADPVLPGRSWIYGYRFQYFHRDRINKLLDFDEITDELFLEFLQSTNDNTRAGVRFRYTALKSNLDGMTLGADNYDHVPALGFFVQTDSRNGVYPTDGWYSDIEASKWGVFGGDADYWRLDVDMRFYTPLPRLGDRHSMTLSSFASLVSGGLGDTIPPWGEFFIGGTNSVRGWSLGSRHGQNQWLNTVEYWFKLMDQKRWKFWFIKWRMGLQLGAFGDFGTAWSDYQRLESNMIAGGGAGLRLTLPVITMFRMDLAYGENDLGVRFFIGGAEKAIAQRQRVR